MPSKENSKRQKLEDQIKETWRVYQDVLSHIEHLLANSKDIPWQALEPLQETLNRLQEVADEYTTEKGKRLDECLSHLQPSRKR